MRYNFKSTQLAKIKKPNNMKYLKGYKSTEIFIYFKRKIV